MPYNFSVTFTMYILSSSIPRPCANLICLAYCTFMLAVFHSECYTSWDVVLCFIPSDPDAWCQPGCVHCFVCCKMCNFEEMCQLLENAHN